MARIVLGSYMVRYPLGGNLSWALQYLVGMHRLGHDVYFLERGGEDSCFDPQRGVMTGDCTFGVRAVADLLSRFEMGDRWCFVDEADSYHGVSRARMQDVLATADIFIDMGTHGDFHDQLTGRTRRILIDGLPAFTQVKMEMRDASDPADEYDAYYTNGMNMGTASCSSPTAGKNWRHILHPVATDMFEVTAPPRGAPYTTVMNWNTSERPLVHEGVTYGHKNLEFEKFLPLPGLTDARCEVAISGKCVPKVELASAGWRLRSAHEVTMTFDDFVSYIQQSRGEFSVCSSGYVITNSGWFSDRSSVYLASGRPVIQQETGFSQHLPCGEGLFAVRDADEAAAAIDAIESDYARHARRAREIAVEHLEATKVMGKFLSELGV
jgi:hypothetical protein